MKKTLVAFLIGLTLPATTIADTLEPVQNDVSTRIIGGEPANTSDWKFIASLVRKGQPTSIGHFCGGSFLGGKYVLTAAHCVEGLNADDLDIVLGLYDKNRESQAQRIAIKNIYSHDEYNN
ncbi:trypsin-like serine protease, partial [Vibrio alginolyticus]